MLRINRQKGVVTLMLTIVILMVVTLTTLYTSRVVVTDDKVFGNVYKNAQALDAARSGFDYALAYLNANTSTVTTGLSSCAVGNETYALTSGTLANNATYTMTYGCVTAASTTYLTITAVGANAGGSASKTVKGIVKVLNTAVLTPIMSTGNATVSNSGTVTNTRSGASYSIAAGGTITTTGAGTLTPAATLASNATLSALTTSQMETNFVGQSIASFATTTPSRYMRITCTGAISYRDTTVINSGVCATCTSVPATLCSSGTTTFSNVASTSSALIYFSMGANNFAIANTGNGQTITVGTSTSPVVLVVNGTGGTVTLGGNSNNNVNTFWGNIYTNRPLTIQKTGGNNSTKWIVNGLVFSSGSSLTLSDNSATTIDAIVNGEMVGTNVTNSTGSVNLSDTFLGYITGTYAGLVGSWAISGVAGSGSSEYGLVAGSLGDFTPG